MNVKSKMLAGILLSVAIVMPLVSACGSSSASDGAASASEAKVSSPAIQNNGTLTVCAAFSTGNPPTYYTDSTNNPVGAEVEMAKWIASDLGLQVKF